MPTLDERRDLLRKALKREGARLDDYSDLHEAIGGATEEERKSLARTLPAFKLLEEQGRTRRALYAAASLVGTGAKLRQELIGYAYRDQEKSGLQTTKEMSRAVLTAALERDEAWAKSYWADGWGWHLAIMIWEDTVTFVNKFPACSLEQTYLEAFLEVIAGRAYRNGWESLDENDQRQVLEDSYTLITSRPELLERDFWNIFSVEGMGSSYHLFPYYRTDKSKDFYLSLVSLLIDRITGFREKLLRESLGGLLRDFSANNVRWYILTHRNVNPSEEEILCLFDTYMAVLAAEPSVSVGLAQDMLKKVIEKLTLAQAEQLIDTSSIVFARSEKKLLKAQLTLLASIAKTHPELAERISDLALETLDLLPINLQDRCKKLISEKALTDQAKEDEVSAASVGSVVVPPPRTTPLPQIETPFEAIESETEFTEGVQQLFEGVLEGKRLPSLIDYLYRHPEYKPNEAILKRAKKLTSSILFGRVMIPAQIFASNLLREKDANPEYQGIMVYTYNRKEEGYIPTLYPSVSPYSMLIKQINNPETLIKSPLPYQKAIYERQLFDPKDTRTEQRAYNLWYAFDYTPYIIWTNRKERLIEADSDIAKNLYASNYLMKEVGIISDICRTVKEYIPIIEWTAWALQNNPDILAAHMQIALRIAKEATNVNGVSEALRALGETTQIPHAPTYSAIVLGLSAKEAVVRSVAAEALAALSDKNFVQPELLAEQIEILQKEEFVLAGRLAQSLTDAASISPITGYRVLQTLALLLPNLEGIHQANRLVELTAKLSQEYGMRVSIPENLSKKMKGSSAMAKSLRVIDAQADAPTQLLEEAAAQIA